MKNSNLNKNCISKDIMAFIILMILGCIFFEKEAHSQDIHFSQFIATPLLTNPANTGMAGENFRLSNDFRSQWGRIGIPFRTFYTSLDKKISIADQSFGIGGAIVHDQSSAFNLAADEFFVSFSYSKFVDNHQFSVGLQPGFAYKSFNLNGISFGSQFDGVNQYFNNSLPSGENNLAGTMQYFDMNAGIYWRTLYHTIMPSVGLAVSHIFKPDVSFSTSNTKNHLPRKITLTGQVNIPLSSRIDITPTVLYSSVPGVNELLLGGLEYYSLNELLIPVKKIYTITLVRVNPFRDVDALILGGGVKFSKFDIGISYDINVSPLAKASYFNGAFEISLIYTGDRVKRKPAEPCFIY